MERKEIYALIQQKNLQEEVKKTYGKNYTMVGNSDLMKIIWNYDCTLVDKDPDAPEVEEKKEVEVVNTPEVEETTTTEDAYEAACITFLGILKDTDKLDELLAKI